MHCAFAGKNNASQDNILISRLGCIITGTGTMIRVQGDI